MKYSRKDKEHQIPILDLNTLKQEMTIQDENDIIIERKMDENNYWIQSRIHYHRQDKQSSEEIEEKMTRRNHRFSKKLMKTK